MAYLSIIIPAYNEEKRIGATLHKLYQFLSAQKYDYEVIVVDDGSGDGTISEAEKSALSKIGKLRIVKNDKNMGKGFSVKAGVFNTGAEYVLLTDADLSTPIEEMEKLFSFMKEGYDIVIGSRALKDSDVRVHQPFHREIMGKTFNFFVKRLLIKGFNDTQCGFKLFKGSVARDIASRMKIDGFCFDVEMLYLAKIKGYNIKEVGVAWNNSIESKVRLFHSSATMFLDLLRIRTIHGKGKGKN